MALTIGVLPISCVASPCMPDLSVGMCPEGFDATAAALTSAEIAYTDTMPLLLFIKSSDCRAMLTRASQEHEQQVFGEPLHLNVLAFIFVCACTRSLQLKNKRKAAFSTIWKCRSQVRFCCK